MIHALVMLALSAGRLAPARLECEAAVNPLGIDVPHPRLSWIVESGARGARQTAYRIRVASSSARLAKPDLWDSGRVQSNRTTDVPYRGRVLASAEQAFWSVQVWDGAGLPSKPSAAARWTMHLLKPSDWTAKWIGAGPRTVSNPYVTFELRKTFAVEGAPTRALAFVCGLGQYELSLNGQRVGHDWLSPAWTQYQKTCIAGVYDVTQALRKGANSVGILVGNGMYDMSGDTRGSQQPNRVGPLEAICQLRLEFADGSVRTVGSDTSWRWHASPATYSGEFGGEDWDARREEPGWNTADFDDDGWSLAVATPKPSGVIRGFTHAGPPLRTIETRAPIRVTEPKPNVVVFDLGQNAPYVPELTAQGPAGATVSLWPAEQLYPDGLMDQRTMRAGKHVSLTLRGGPPETWRPSFWYCGSRYWQAEAVGPDGKAIDPRSILRRFRGLLVYASAPPAGEFECSNELLNRIHSMIRWSIRSNLSHVITDCPHREKSGWLEQDHLMGPGLLYTYDMRRIFGKTVHDMVDAQHPDCRVPTMAPEYFFYDGPFADSVEWGASIGLVPRLMRDWYGDLDAQATALPALKRYFAYLQSRAKDNILADGLGDWNGGGNDPRTPVALTDTAYFYALARVLADEAPSTYASVADAIRDAFNRKFLDPATGKYATGSQSCQATALDLGLVPAAVVGKAFDRLLDDVAAQHYAVSCGEVGHPALLHVLAAHGRSDLIAKIHLQSDKPGYGYQLKKGLTTLAESWDASPISLNHFMLGQLIEWMYADLVGIRPDPARPGFLHAIIAPTPVSQVQWARASYDSCHGLYKVAWHMEHGRFTLDVTVPANCSATVILPVGDATTENGRALPLGAKRRLEVASGHSTIVVTRRP